MISVKVHKSYREVIAVCDENLLGRKLQDGKRELDISENFFKGELMDEENVSSEIACGVREDATFNIVGENSVRIAKEMGIIDDNGIMEIEGVPFSLVLL